MARKLIWKDLIILHDLQGQRMVLDNSLRLVHNPGMYSSSVLSLLFPRSEFYSAVDPQRDDSVPFVFGQMTLNRKNLTARLACLAPEFKPGNLNFNALISHLVSAAGERGAIQVVGEVPRGSQGELVLSRCGFRPYAEQQIWKLPRQVSYGAGQRSWIPASRGDNERVSSLVQRLIPGKIQYVEAPPRFPESQGMISWREGRLVGLALMQFGPQGILLDLLLDTNPGSIDEYISSLMFHLPYRSTREVYLRVRSYQQELTSALERIGALPGEQQYAVVKKMAVHYNAKQTFAVRGFEKQPDITTPISNTKLEQ